MLIVRLMMDQAASIVLIYCFILITEVIVGMIIVTLISSSIEYYDDIDNVIQYVDNIDFRSDRYILYRSFQESIFELLDLSKISKNPVETVSVSTQTDDTMISDPIFMGTSPSEKDKNEIDMIIECLSCPSSPVLLCSMPETKEIQHENEVINILDMNIPRNDNDSEKKINQIIHNTWRDCQFSSIETFWTHLFVRT